MYPYYEQYLTIWQTMFITLSCSLLAVFIVTFILTSFDFKSSLIVLLTVFMILIDLTGLMYWWSINLNAITLVNLVVVSNIIYSTPLKSIMYVILYKKYCVKAS